jgi:ABC-type antimicrobial peptide transport system permease subunit
VALSLRAGAVQAGAGLVIGVAFALGLTRVMRAFLHGVAPTDPVTFVTVLLVTGAVALAASVWPARRAGRVDPAAVLHEG